MSEFKKHFDDIEATDVLQEKVLERTRQTSACTKISQNQRRDWTRLTAFFAASIFAVALFIPMLAHFLPSRSNSDFEQVHQVQSVRHLASLLEMQDRFPIGGGSNWGWEADGSVRDSTSPPGANTSGGDGGSSTTNIQVVGMDEGDIVRNDGQYIYRLSPSGLTIVETNQGRI